MATISFHASDENEQAIRALAAHQGIGVSAFVNQVVEEGLRMRRFPGVVYRTGATGRRAALAGSLDIWEVIAILAEFTGDQAALLAAYPSLTSQALKTVQAYYAAYPLEIDSRIAMSNQQEAEIARELPALFHTSVPTRPARSPRKPGKRT